MPIEMSPLIIVLIAVVVFFITISALYQGTNGVHPTRYSSFMEGREERQPNVFMAAVHSFGPLFRIMHTWT